jgi:hypothetical protein
MVIEVVIIYVDSFLFIPAQDLENTWVMLMGIFTIDAIKQ